MFEYNLKYCEWKKLEIADSDCKTVHFNYKTDCGRELLVSRDNKYGKLIRREGSICPFCKKQIDIRMYE